MQNGSLEVFANGVYKLNSKEKGPEVISFENKLLYRFMDHLYVEKENLEDLTSDEVSDLCRARASYPVLIDEANSSVKKNFKEFIHRKNPQCIFEIGAGESPLLDCVDTKVSYAVCDADASLLDKEKKGLVFHNFSFESPNIPFGDNYFDLVVAVFVLHFQFYEVQIKELARCIADDGVFLANIYRRKESGRVGLVQKFEQYGFYVFRLEDPQELCKNHEYWVIGKKEKNVESDVALFKSILT
ncbi:class I SAM-dependent methyltransferase [Vreelandella venusta]|uniref:class I SAM-dependent methyltransferase n=1 Tax=Vreelandella venusta TaxID=44935 RepID=UPI00384B1C00